MSDDRQLSWYGFFAWSVVGFYVWKFEREKVKALEASKLQASSLKTALMINFGLGLIATGIVALSLENVGVALVLFGIARWLISHA